MNFEDEAYVRLYIRRTVTNRRLGWEGRAVMHEMLYEFDRAGVFELDGTVEDAVELVTGLPRKVVKLGLGRLLTYKTWVLQEGRIVWPRFLEAQTARRSDAIRAAEYRARRRDAATEGPNERDEPSQDVTESHEESQAVTESHGRHETSLSALPSSTLPGLAHTDAGARDDNVGATGAAPHPLPADVTGLQAKAMAWERDPTTTGYQHGSPETWPEVIASFEDFGTVWPPPGKLLSRDTRATIIVARFAQGITPAALAKSARGAKLDEHIARNKQFQTVKTIWRDEGQVEKFAALLDSPPQPKRGATPTQPNYGTTTQAEEYPG